jgi:hypothetical protein
MLLGIFGGGFKPFTSGHFSKLALAAKENDRVLLLFGMAERKKGSEFIFDSNMVRVVFENTKTAVERHMKNVVVLEGRPSPVALTFGFIGAVAHPEDSDFDLGQFGVDASQVERIKVYSDPSDANIYKKHIGTDKEHKYFGNLCSSGRLVFDSGLDNGHPTRIISALKRYLPHANQEDLIDRLNIRGTQIRDLLLNNDYETFKKYLPPILNHKECENIINALTQRITECLRDTYLKNLIVETLNQSREEINLISEASPEAHILNFYEDLNMPLYELIEAFNALLEARIENVEEKMDGQNLLFTVRNGNVETFVKSVSWDRLQQGGKLYSDYDEVYASLPSVRDAYKQAHMSLQTAVNNCCPECISSLFLNGSVVIETAIIIPSNPNVIRYDNPTIRFIKPHAINPDLNDAVDIDAYRTFVHNAKNTPAPVEMGTVPLLNMKRVRDAEMHAQNLISDLEKLMRITGVNYENTIGDLLLGLAVKRIKNMGFSDNVAHRIAFRVVMKNKKSLSKKEANDLGPHVWDVVQRLEASYFTQENLVPLERIIQKLALVIFRNLEFVLASNDDEYARELRVFISKAREAFNAGKILGDQKQLEAVRVSLERLGDESQFDKAVEGIVFQWNGKTRKLTGMFSPLNKLKGVFKYGKNPLPMFEGKNRKGNAKSKELLPPLGIFMF